jgi:hypothetical protein
MQHMARTRGWRWWIYRGIAVVGALVIVALLAVSWAIGSGVQAATRVAVREHGGDGISALMAYVESPSRSLGDRNRAVWALGQLGDARALTVLEKHYAGKPCDHSRLLCQTELKKAIHLCRGGLNVSALVWRHESVTRAGSS